MKITCKTNDLSSLVNKKLRGFAFMQDEKGIVALTPGQKYTIYGRKENIFGGFFFVVQDDETLPWWMPEGLFEEVEFTPPPEWKTEEYPSDYGGTAIESAPEIYSGHEIDIEDSTPEGYKAFDIMKKMVKD